MQRTMLKSKLHRATVTDANWEYEGSITIDYQLMKAADLWPHERVEVYNIDNGSRFATYVIEGKPGSGAIEINGAAAHLAHTGQKVIICSYAGLEESDLKGYEPNVILLDDQNQPKSPRP